jgi:hypothetical protein
MRFLFALLLSTSLCNATVYTYSSTSGNVTINGAGGSGYASLVAGDVLNIQAGVYSGYSVTNVTGTSVDSIVINWQAGAVIDNNFCGFCFNEWRNVHYVKMIGLTAVRTGVGIVDMRINCDNIRITSYSFNNIGNASTFSNNFAVNIADTYGAGEIFDGTVNSTFYNIRMDNGFIRGFQNNDVIRLGKGDNSNVVLNFQFDNNICRGFVNTGSSITPIIAARSAFGLKVFNNLIDSFPRSTGTNTHNAAFRIIGNGKFYNNKFKNLFANRIRIAAVRLSSVNPGVVATGATDSVYIFNNIDSFSTCYPSYETNPNLESGGVYDYVNNLSGGNTRFCGTIIANNSTIKTSIDPYNNYHGALADVYGYSSGNYGANVPANNYFVSVKNNFIAEQANSGTIGYNNLTVFGNGLSGFTYDTTGNLQFATVANALINTTTFAPSNTSLLYNSGVVNSSLNRTLDYYGNTVPFAGIADKGAVESGASAPAITTGRILKKIAEMFLQ